MPKKIDDILNPPPPPPSDWERELTRILRDAKKDGAALTWKDIWFANRIAWFPRGTGDMLLMMGMAALTGEKHHQKEKDACVAALQELVSRGAVTSREDNGETYYWWAD